MDKVGLGERVARARELAGLTQEDLGRAVGLDRTAIVRLEKGDRKLSVPELVTIAESLERSLAFFVEAPVPAAVSRRSDTGTVHDSTPVLDAELEQFAADVRVLLDLTLLEAVERSAGRTPRDHADAERSAQETRRRLALADGPVVDLGSACDAVGLLTYSASLGEYGSDGGCVEVGGKSAAVGVAVINGDAQPGRRRMTLAHELGHWLAGDAYDAGASRDAERMLNSFAIHFLAPRAAVMKLWSDRGGSPRDRALAVSATFQLSWTAAIGQLQNLDLISTEQRQDLEDNRPTKGDFFRLGLRWSDDMDAPYVSPRFAAAVLDGYAARRLTPERTLELLRGTLAADDLPRQDEPSIDDVRPAFRGHGA